MFYMSVIVTSENKFRDILHNTQHCIFSVATYQGSSWTRLVSLHLNSYLVCVTVAVVTQAVGCIAILWQSTHQNCVQNGACNTF